MPLLGRLRVWLDAQASTALPKLKLGEAVGYARNQWSALASYVDDGRLPLRQQRRRTRSAGVDDRTQKLALHRQPRGGAPAAVLYTIVASAARHDLDVWAYLRDVLERLAEWAQQTGGSPPPEQLTPLLPDVWAKSHPESLRSYRQHERENRSAAQRNRRQKRRALAQSANQRNG